MMNNPPDQPPASLEQLQQKIVVLTQALHQLQQAKDKHLGRIAELADREARAAREQNGAIEQTIHVLRDQKAILEELL